VQTPHQPQLSAQTPKTKPVTLYTIPLVVHRVYEKLSQRSRHHKSPTVTTVHDFVWWVTLWLLVLWWLAGVFGVGVCVWCVRGSR
jgi:hypothetical protein